MWLWKDLPEMSMYCDYLKEVYGKNVTENHNSVIVWTMNAETLYIEDMYIKPEFRACGLGKDLMQAMIHIAKGNGCTKLLTSITMLNKYRDLNMQIFLKQGFSISSLGAGIIYLVKEI